MIAGNVSVTVSADYANFDQGMKAVEARATTAGANAGSGFAKKLGERFAANTEKMGSRLAGMFGPQLIVGVADAFTESLNEGGSIGSALMKGFRTLPLASTFMDLGDAISNRLLGTQKELNEGQNRYAEDLAYTAQKEAEIAELHEANIASAAKAEAAAAEAAKKQIEETARLEQSMSDLREKKQMSQAELELKLAREVGDERKAIDIEFDMAHQQLFNKQNELMKGKTDDEKRAVGEVMQLEYQGLLANQRVSLAKLAEREKAEADALDEASMKRAEDAEKDAAATLKRQGKLSEDLASADVESMKTRVGVASSTATRSTALGSFSFGAYSDTEKKKNDELQVGYLKVVAEKLKMQSIGGFA